MTYNPDVFDSQEEADAWGEDMRRRHREQAVSPKPKRTGPPERVSMSPEQLGSLLTSIQMQPIIFWSAAFLDLCKRYKLDPYVDEHSFQAKVEAWLLS